VKTCHICEGTGKLPVTQVPHAESNGEEMPGDCPNCNGKGMIEEAEGKAN